MRRFIGSLAGVGAVALATAGIAQAAATPTVSTGAAVKVTTTTAVVRAHVNPEGQATAYAFNYGVTPSYGSATVARSAGSGSKSVFVRDRITGLEPGTTYHYQVTASNASGPASGIDATFTTAGTPPSSVLTGPPSVVGETTATVTATINPNGPDTPYLVQYGKTTSYGLQTFEATVPAGTAPVPVQVGLPVLSPGTLIHYRFVSYHGSTASYGADATLFTRPVNPPSPDMSTKITPSHDAKAPFTFTASGTLRGGSYIPAAQRCTGTVAIRYYNGKHQLGAKLVGVSPSCQFSGKTSFSKLHGSGPVKLRVSIFYRGNGFLAKASKIDHPVAGK